MEHSDVGGRTNADTINDETIDAVVADDGEQT